MSADVGQVGQVRKVDQVDNVVGASNLKNLPNFTNLQQPQTTTLGRPPWLVFRLGKLSFKLDRRVPLITLLCVLTAVGIFLWNVGTGEYPIAPTDVVKAVLKIDTGNPDHDFIINTLRLPRALVAFVVGVMLALAGSIMQTLTRNPLASPDITGVTAGASLGAVLLILVAPSSSLISLPLAALGGGFAVALLIYVLAWRRGDSPMRLVLVGIGLGAIFGAAQSILLLRADIEKVQQALYWLTGSIYARSWENLAALAPWCIVLIPLTLLSARHLNALNLGEDVARGLGGRVSWQRALFLLLAVGLTGAAISQVGAIGFVGLIAPHLARKLVGPAHEGSLAVSGLLGGLLVLASDFIGRTVLSPVEIPAGIIVALVGAPFFIYLLWRSRQQ